MLSKHLIKLTEKITRLPTNIELLFKLFSYCNSLMTKTCMVLSVCFSFVFLIDP